MKLYKCIVSGFLAIAIIFSMTIPAFAVDSGAIVGAMEVAPDFGSWLWSTMKGTVNTIGSFISDDVCPGSSEEPGYNFRHNFVPQDTIVNGKAGTYYICKNCGLSAGEVLTPAYDTYVETLPAQGYNSDGSLMWSPAPSMMEYVSNYDGAVVCEHFLESEKNDNFNYDKATVNASFNCSANSMVVVPEVGANSSSYAYD